ncbi:MAG: hypothetical protein EPN71_01005 [Rhodanobacter sp.]|nr:MAG: hypothetical protein EPN71_01005 [Rhodanobacter sp.]
MLLALLPWWLGLPLLMALAAAALLLQHRLAPRHAMLIRAALYWGWAGWLLTLPRALGGGVVGWGAILLGALAGYTLLIGLDVWLQRDQRRASGTAASSDWPELARSPIGPSAQIIELQPPAWQPASGELPDPQGGTVQCSVEGCQFAGGERIEAPGAVGFAQACFSPHGRWFAACTPEQRTLALWDRQRERRHCLRGWHLCGWYREQPWLSRREGEMPLALHAVLGDDDKG